METRRIADTVIPTWTVEMKRTGSSMMRGRSSAGRDLPRVSMISGCAGR